MNWKFESFNDAAAPDEGYYTLAAGPLYAVIEPGSQTVAVWANLDGNAVLANHTGFDSLAEAQQTALDLLESTLKGWLADIRQAVTTASPDLERHFEVPPDEESQGWLTNLAGGGDGDP